MNTILLLIMSVLSSINTMEIKSPSFESGSYIPLKYSCEGQNINPPVTIQNVPDSAKSIALTIDDPDATKGVFDHWVIWNIQPGTNVNIEENSAPGDEGKNGSGKIGYTGPCPPQGTGVHHYHFRVYALDEKLSLEKGADKKQLLKAMEGHVISEAEIIGLYTKTK